ncbi:exocyst complex component EXO70A1 [Sesamum indicum]|uniref:Exocyst subunit Exo70 family protein n=1 Tax=Sesamum indicum TaxID=4182 RepID=A0A6I9U0W5_SESIN|nr:exocyst complex component EXO70A1 [Sesamum indicum]
MKDSTLPCNPSSPLPSISSSTPPCAADQEALSETMIEESISRAEPIIRKWDLGMGGLQKFSSLFVDDRREAKSFFEAATSLQQAINYYLKQSAASEELIRVRKLMKVAMKRLEKEFHMILSANRKNLDSGSVSSRSSRTRSSFSEFFEFSEEEVNSTSPPRTSPPPPPTPGGNAKLDAERATEMAMADLMGIADCMIACGYGRECIRVYKSIRKSMVIESLYHLGVERLSHPQMKKMEWLVLEPKIKRWLRVVKFAVKTLLQGEKILCEIVFSEKVAESCFLDISCDAAWNLFSFPENVAKCKKLLSPEKMFIALDIYEAVSDLSPEIESLFASKFFTSVRAQATAAQAKMGEAVRTILGQFEAAIQKDSSKSPVAGGVHPLTRYVMNYLVFLSDYSVHISNIVKDGPVNPQTPLPEPQFSSLTAVSEEDPSATPISRRLAWLILVLFSNLDSKAAQYNNAALPYLFLANNLNYVVYKVQNSNLGLLIGSNWIRKHESKVKRYLAKYEKLGWSKILSSLPENPTGEISPKEVKECFKKFNSSFQEAYKKQCSWVIPDPKIRESVKASVSKRILSSYLVFHQKHRGKHAKDCTVESFIRYTPEDLEKYFSHMFSEAAGVVDNNFKFPKKVVNIHC